MKHNIIQCSFSILLLLGGAIAHAQDSGSGVLENPQLANARELLQAGREDIIREDLQMTVKESSGFWPVYNAYRDEIMLVRDKRATMVAGFLQAYRDAEITDEFAEGLIRDHFEAKSELLDIQKRFVPRFREVLPVLKVARFYQLENKMDAEIDAQLALVIPLVES